MKNNWDRNTFFVEAIIFLICFIIVTFLGKKYLPPTYYENGQPKLSTIVILSLCLGLLTYLTNFFFNFN